jgi:4-amino-4-deoxy-L-arabinose transferase-like glycosyltransferase
MTTVDRAAKATPWWRDLLWLTVGFGLLYFFLLGRAPLANPDEGRYGEIPREMVATGDWVTPRLDGVNYFEKPPLMYWAVAVALQALGGNEGVLRTVPALFGLAGVLLTYAAARRLYGRAAGLGAGVVLGTCGLYAALARLLILDMAVSVLMSATLFCFILGVLEPVGRRRRWFFYGLYASAALATLTKGLMGFLVTGAVMLLWLAVCGQWRRLRPLYLPSGAFLFLLLAAPWHLLAASRNPGWAHFYFIHEHWERFTTTTHGRFHPWYWFIPILLGGLFPWVGWLGAGLRAGLAGGWAKRAGNAGPWFFVLWAAFIFAFFSKSQSKLAPYILPVFPPLAVLIGLVVGPAWRDQTFRTVARGLWTFILIGGVLAAALVVAAAIPERFRIQPADAERLRPIALAAAAVLVGGVVSSLIAARRRETRAALTAVVMTMALFLGVLEFGTGLFGPPSTKAVARWVRTHVRPGDRIFFYAGFFHDFLFYSRQPVGAVGFHGDEVELLNDPVATASGRFIEKPAFLAEWAKAGRILVLARRSAPETGVLLGDPAFHYHLLLQTPDFYLFSNQL